MARLLLALFGVALVFSLAVAALAYGSGPTRSGEVALDGLRAPVTLAWGDSGRVVIEAETPADLVGGLGYVHAADHAWTLVLWRQIARGTTAEWFGDSAATRDRHARTLGLDALAQETYRRLPTERRALLDAYARGVNLALADPGVAQGDPFVLTGVEPEPWRPWDALSVERLVAYLSTTAPQQDSSWAVGVQDADVAQFVRTDSSFRAFAGFGDASLSRAFVAGPGPDLYVHAATGASALRAFAPVELRVGGRSVLTATIPGTLLAPVGTGPDGAWGFLLSSALRLEPLAGRRPAPVYSRVVERDGDETLLTTFRDSTGLALGVSEAAPPPRAPRPDTSAAAGALPSADSLRAGPPGPPAASGWRVVWSGFRVGTDVFAWSELWAGRAPGRFHLFRGDGLLTTGAASRVVGRPVVAQSGPGYTFVAEARPARYAAARLDTLARDSSVGTPGALVRDAQSAWAAGLVPSLVRALGNRDSLGVDLQAPYSYLRGWDFAYTAGAIAPSLFEGWLLAHQSVTGSLPNLSDTLDVRLLPYTLRIAQAELHDRFGPLPTDWRWGVVQGGLRYPVLGAKRSAVARPYRLTARGAGGHPTALRPGPSLAFAARAPGDPLFPRHRGGVAVWSFRVSPRDGALWVWPPVTVPTGNAYPEPVGDDLGPPLAFRSGTAASDRRLVLVPRS